MTEYRPLYRLCTAVMLLALVGVYLQFRVRNNRFNQGHNIDTMPDRGFDLEAYHLFASQWWKGESPYSERAPSGPNPYPPFFTLFFSPFALLPFQTAYLAVVLVSTGALLLSIYVATHASGAGPPDWLKLATWAAVLTHTYPVLFVLERGTPELVILALMSGGLYMLVRGRWGWAVVLFALATHLKLYPLILVSFVFLRGGIRATLWFSAIVLALFLVLGVDALRDFVETLGGTIVNPAQWIWPGNHSTRSFAQWAAYEGWFPVEYMTTIAFAINVTLLTAFGAMLLATWLTRGQRPIGPFTVRELALIGMAFVLMSLVPPFSHDYKLSIQAIPFLLLITSTEADDAAARSQAVRNRCVVIAVLLAFIVAPLVRVPKTSFLIPLFFAYGALWVVAPRRLDLAATDDALPPPPEPVAALSTKPPAATTICP
jgi:hypothetical protein